MAQPSDVREVLQYIPQFRGKVFLVLIEAGLLPEPAVAETLLDLAVLEDLGVKLVLGVLVAAGWKLRWTALLSAALLVADAVLSHPFWTLAEPARSAQLLHFMKNVAIVGGFLLLSLGAPARRR